MTKIKVFIDFEAISSPLSREAKLLANFPFAYTLGLYVGKKFKTKTFIFNFLKTSLQDSKEVFRAQIIYDIRQILNQKSFKVNKNTVEFIGWSPILEKKIIARIFPGLAVNSLNKGFELSLSRLTPEIAKDYFAHLKSTINQQKVKERIIENTLKHDGALAAYGGYLLHAQVHNQNGKYFVDCDLTILLKELRKYSQDDVLRMDFLYSNPNIFHQRREKALLLVKQKTKLKNNINNIEKILKVISRYDNKKTIGQIRQELTKELRSLSLKKAKLEKDFQNI